MNRITAFLLAVGLLAAPAFAEVPPTKTPAPAAAQSASNPKQQKVALAKKRTTHHRRHKRPTHVSKPATK